MKKYANVHLVQMLFIIAIGINIGLMIGDAVYNSFGDLLWYVSINAFLSLTKAFIIDPIYQPENK